MSNYHNIGVIDGNNYIYGVNNNLIDPNSYNLDLFNNSNSDNTKNDNRINIECVENHLKYEKYSYSINMENQPNIDKTLDDVAVKLTNVAETGVKVFDNFLTSLSPKVENVLNTVLKDQTNVNEKKTNLNKNNPYFYKETESNILVACEIPRVEKNNCRIKLDNNNILNISAKTSAPKPDSDISKFNFMEQREYTFEIKISKDINSKMIIAKIIDGVLYIEISKKLINIEEINIL